jgi:hypothetical protein
MHASRIWPFKARYIKNISFYIIFLFAILSYFKCENSPALSGYYKMNRIEVFQNDNLAKIIDTGFQYWNFSDPSAIKIYNKQGVQKVLYIKKINKRIHSMDTNTGKILEVFVIRKSDPQSLELCSTKKLYNKTYDIIYFLEKMNAGELQKELINPLGK